MTTKLVLIVFVTMLLPYILTPQVLAQPGSVLDETARARMGVIQENTPFRSIIEDAVNAYSAIVTGQQRAIPANVLQNARCIAVFPGIVTGAFVIGGTYGDGLASCKLTDGNWSHPAAITLRKGSLGLQAGAKSADMVLFFQTEKAEQALKRGDFTLGTDISAVAGKFDGEFKPTDAAVVVYSRSRGLFAGVSINGSTIGKNQDELTEYYGRQIDYTSLLNGGEISDKEHYAQKLTDLFPQS
jgi:SH3 domain-containing YSC84-like protein 1